MILSESGFKDFED